MAPSVRLTHTRDCSLSCSSPPSGPVHGGSRIRRDLRREPWRTGSTQAFIREARPPMAQSTLRASRNLPNCLPAENLCSHRVRFIITY